MQHGFLASRTGLPLAAICDISNRIMQDFDGFSGHYGWHVDCFYFCRSTKTAVCRNVEATT